jgi:PAS domain S-box-containing protein
MLSRSGLNRKRNIATIVIGAALLGCLTILLIANYQSLSLLRKSTLDMVQHHAEKRAAALGYFFSERKDDLRYLSDSIERSAFFENRALGMSMEYGLYEGVLAIGESFERVLQRKTLGVHHVYSQILFVEPDGHPLVARAVDSPDASAIPQVMASLNPGDPSPQILVRHVNETDVEVLIALSHYHNRTYRGHILATVSIETLSERLFRDSAASAGQISYIITDQGKVIWHSHQRDCNSLSPPLPPHQDLPLGGPHRFSHTTGDGSQERYIALKVSIPGSPLSVVNVHPEAHVLGRTEPAMLLVVIAALSILLFSGMSWIIRVNTRNQILEARLDEASKARALVEQGNRALARENADRLRTEAALRESERRYRDLTDFLPQPVFEINAEGLLTFANHAALAAFDYSMEDMEDGLHALQFVAPEDRLRASENIRRRFAGEELPNSEYMGQRKDGSRFPILIYTAPILKNARSEGLRGIIIDATEQKRIELEREATIDILRLMNSNMSIEELAQNLIERLSTSIACDTVRIRVNWENACNVFQGRDLSDPPAFSSNHSCHSRWPKTPNGNGENGNGAHCLCDEMLQRYGQADTSSLGISGTLHLSGISSIFKEIPKDEPCWSECPHFMDLDCYESLLLVSLKFGRKHMGSLYLCDRRPDFFTPDHVRFVERIAENIASALAQRCADQERNRLTSVVDQATETIIITDPQGTICYVNPAFERVSGFRKEEVLNRNARILKSGMHDGRYYSGIRKTLERGETWSGRLINRRKDGTLFEEEGTISPVRDESGKIINYVAVKRDVTQEVALEKQLRQAQKMEALGTLAGGIAHDFNNILAAILGYAELSMGSQSLDERLRNNLEQVIKAGKRARDLVQQILAFSRQSEQERKPVQLGSVIQEVLALLRASLPTTIDIRFKGERQNGLVMADPTQIHQLLMNLCSNAAYAMNEKGGSLHVELSTNRVGAHGFRMSGELSPGSYVRLTVRDTGHGIPPALLDRIFDPYFTTKEKGTGTGLGLAVVHGIVKSHDGAIAVESELGKGTSFHVFLPVIEASSSSARDEEDAPSGGSERILLVDDEDTLVELGSMMLEGMGYKVNGQTSSLEALDLFRQDPRGFDLVITDLTMPQMTGLELAQELLRIRPDLPIILCTGYSENLMPQSTRAMGVRELMTKPFLVRDLARTIRNALDDPGPKTPAPHCSQVPEATAIPSDSATD